MNGKELPIKRFVSLLRGVNVGDRNRIRMEDLAAVYRGLGLLNVRTYVRSGNVIFDSPVGDPDEMSSRIGGKITETSGFPVGVLIRTVDDLRRIIADNPFVTRGMDPAGMHVTFLSGMPHDMPPDGEDKADRFVLSGREVYLYIPQGYGRTKFSNAFFEKKSGLMATTRNWRTVTTLLELAGG